MKRLMCKAAGVWLVLAACPAMGLAQGVLVPTRPIPVPRSYAIKALEVDASIRDQVASVQVSQTFVNPGSAVLEVQFLFPLPYDGAIDQMTMLVDGKEMPARLLKREEARRIYEEIVRGRRDPALLEYLGRGAFQTRVFPLPPGAERKVTLRYSQICRKDSGLVDFLYPLATAKYSAQPIENLRITVRIESTSPLKAVYSPTHPLETQRPDDYHAVLTLRQSQAMASDDFRLLYDTAAGAVGANVLSYRPVGEDGYFLLLASPEVKPPDGPPAAKTVVFVVDRSGSMSGEKIEQAKGALRFVLNNLREGDTFNVVAYDSTVETFRPELQRFDDTTRKAALAFVDGLVAGGSTNIDGALKTALGMLADKSRPSYVIFLTDGLPTTGETREGAIVENARQANGVRARVSAFGVGYDVNSRLLDSLVRANHGQSEYVRPNENIEERVSRFYAKIGAPAMTELAVQFAYDAAATTAEPAPIYQTLPRELPDLFRGQQLVWVGRYRKPGAVKVTLSGMVGQQRQSFDFAATLVEQSRDETYGFVAKLWAGRRIGDIIDELDLKGHNQELVDELVALSLRHGILTQYTAFLADERTDLRATAVNRQRAGEGIMKLSEQLGGQGGVEQRLAKGRFQLAEQATQGGFAGGGGGLGGPGRGRRLFRQGGGGFQGGFQGGGAGQGQRLPAAGLSNAAVYLDEEGDEVEAESVQVIGQKTFFRRGRVWYDSTVTAEQEKTAVVVEQFSDAYFELANRQGASQAKYLAFSEPVVVNLEGKTYRMEAPRK